MTFGEKRRALRSLRSCVDAMRGELLKRFAAEGFSVESALAVSLTLPRDEYERCEWALQFVKQWIPDIDPETGELLKTGGYARLNGLYVLTSEPREHFLIKGCPVFYAD